MKKNKLNKSIIGILVLVLILSLGGCGEKKTEEVEEEESVVQVIEEDYDAEENKIDTEANEGTIIQKGKDAGREYLDSTLFLGDSNTVRFQGYEDEDGKRFTSINNSIGVVGMGVGAISSLKCVELEGKGRVTMVDAVKALQPERVIIFFGTNNLNGTSTDATSFIKTYRDNLKAIQKAYPSVDMIIGSIFPVAQARDYPHVSMTQIDAYNKAILAMCEEEGYKFLNASEALKDEKTGYAKKGYCISDGLHLSKEGITALFDYIRTHSYITEDDRPKPLAAIPKVIGVPSGLISDNPLATSSNRIPVEFTCSAGGYLTGNTSQMVASGAASGAVTAVANAGYHFAYWASSTGEYFNSATLSYTVYRADANGIILTAYFEADAPQEEEKKEEEKPKEEPKQEEPQTYTANFYDCSKNVIHYEEVAVGGTPNYILTGAGKDHQWTKDNAGNYWQQDCVTHTHEYTWVRTTDPTCDTKGLETGTCSCGDTTTREVDVLTGDACHVHSLTWSTTTSATCEAPGVETGTCTCGYSETRPIQQLTTGCDPKQEEQQIDVNEIEQQNLEPGTGGDTGQGEGPTEEEPPAGDPQ